MWIRWRLRIRELRLEGGGIFGRPKLQPDGRLYPRDGADEHTAAGQRADLVPGQGRVQRGGGAQHLPVRQPLPQLLQGADLTKRIRPADRLTAKDRAKDAATSALRRGKPGSIN